MKKSLPLRRDSARGVRLGIGCFGIPGLVGGSFMTGQPRWIGIGAVTAIIGFDSGSITEARPDPSQQPVQSRHTWPLTCDRAIRSFSGQIDVQGRQADVAPLTLSPQTTLTTRRLSPQTVVAPIVAPVYVSGRSAGCWRWCNRPHHVVAPEPRCSASLILPEPQMTLSVHPHGDCSG